MFMVFNNKVVILLPRQHRLKEQYLPQQENKGGSSYGKLVKEIKHRFDCCYSHKEPILYLLTKGRHL